MIDASRLLAAMRKPFVPDPDWPDEQAREAEEDAAMLEADQFGSAEGEQYE